MYKSKQAYRTKHLPPLVFIIITLFIGCKDVNNKMELDAGSIEYKITFLEDAQEQFLMSNRLNLYFKQNNTSIVLKGFMNMFEFKYLTLLEKDKNYSILRVVDKTYVFEQGCGTPAYGYEEMGKLKIEQTNETKIICGYECKKAIVIDNNNTFPVYYTNEIQVSEPNINNPFKKIDGVLLEFQVNLNNIKMKFTAINVDKSSPDDSKFKLPDKYRKVKKQQIDSIFKIYQDAINS